MPNKTRAEVTKNSRIRTFYGLRPSEPEDMAQKQGGVCAICLRPFGCDKMTSPHIDHDHSSGWVRGILCNACNFAIGNFEEDIDRMQRAIDYLISNATPTEFNIGAARAAVRIHPADPRKFSPTERERRKKLMEGNTWRQGLPAWNKGKQWDDATREKMSAAAKSRWARENSDAQ